MNKQIIVIIMGIALISLASAVTIYAGDCLEVDLSELESLDNVVYDVVGNSSDMIGMSITLNETTKNVSVCFVFNFKSDSFTLIFIDNSTKEIIKEVYVGGGGSRRTKYVYRDVIIEKEVKKIIGNETDKYGCLFMLDYRWCESKQRCIRLSEEKCEDEVIKVEEDEVDEGFDWQLFVIIFGLTIIIFYLCRNLFKRSKQTIKEDDAERIENRGEEYT